MIPVRQGLQLVRLRTAACVAAVLLGLATAPGAAGAWGDRTHPAIVRLAAESLPRDAASYFGPLLDDMARRSVEPDTVLRARDGDREKIRHFCDLEFFGKPPFAGLPRSQREAERRLGGEKLRRAGVLPWVVVRFERQLREAIREGNSLRVAREAGYLAHYVADAYQPLHLTVNYDGLGEAGRGLHRRFEDGLVDAGIDRFVGSAKAQLRPAAVVPDRLTAVLDDMVRSYAEVEPLLQADADTRAEAAVDTPEYYVAFGRRVDRLVNAQLARGASMLGSLWLTAWRETQQKR